MALRISTQVQIVNVIKLVIVLFMLFVRTDAVNIISKPLFAIELLSATFCVLDLSLAVCNRGKIKVYLSI